MIKTISSRLTAQFKVDASHLDRYLKRSKIITNSVCEDLIINDQVVVPTQDYLTAVGLILILGEKSLIKLLERERLKFIRTRHSFGYIRGEGPEGALVSFGTENKEKAQDTSVEKSVALALRTISDRLTEDKLITDLLVESSFEEQTPELIDAVQAEAIADFKQTPFWTDEYAESKPNCLRLPGMAKMQCKVVGAADDPYAGPVEFFLSLAIKNIDLFLAEKYDCQNISPFYPIGDFLETKSARVNLDNFSSTIEVMGVPDFSVVDFSQENLFSDFLKATESENARVFKDWLASLDSIDSKEVLSAYIEVLKDVPWLQRLPAKGLRFAATSIAGLVPGVGSLAGLFDAFVLDTIFREKSPKYFIDDLTKFTELSKPK